MRIEDRRSKIEDRRSRSSLIAVITLALGIGANTAIFLVLNALVLRPLPVERPEELVYVHTSDASGENYRETSYLDYADWRAQNTVFADLATQSVMAFNVAAGARTERLNGEIVSHNYFNLLGVRPILGRAFAPEEERAAGAHPVAMISERLWRHWFGADPALLGRTINLNGATFTVIGVVPDAFHGLQLGPRPQVWIPVMRMNRYEEARGRAFYKQVIERVRALPGVESAALASYAPLGLHGALGGSHSAVRVEGYEPGPGVDTDVEGNIVSPDYFDTMQIPLLRGRAFADSDKAVAPSVAIINEAFARRFWPGEDPIGKRVGLDPSGRGLMALQEPMRVVVGMVKDGKYRTLGEAQRAMLYLPLEQNYDPNLMTLHVRTPGDPLALLSAVRGAAQALDPNLPLYDVSTLRSHMGVALFLVRAAATLLALFGALALLLSGVGLYGVMAFSVSQRAREIGIRMALGAQVGDVLKLVVDQGMTLALIGVAIGLAVALTLTRLIASLLYGVSAADPLTYGAVALLLGGVALLACYVPARRAMKVDPMVALRIE